MKPNRTNERRPGTKKNTRSKSQADTVDALDHAVVLIDTVCVIAGSEDLIAAPNDRSSARLRSAITRHDTALLFDRLIEAFSYQGISDQVALTYMNQHGRVRWRDIERTLAGSFGCTKLQSYWAFHSCGYEKGSRTCAEPDHIGLCHLPRFDLRNGRLNQTAYSLHLFIRDVADGDLVAWIDRQLRRASRGADRSRLSRLRESLIGPLRNVYGVSDKVLAMSLSDVLLAAPPTKRLWFDAGVSMIAIDTLVHNFLHRTGILRRFDAQHAYGPSCYQPDGCADIISQIAARIDARQTCSKYPATFPRFVQHAIWRFCAQQEFDICNGNRIHDQRRCGNKGCPLFHLCDRVTLQNPKAAHR